MRIYTVVRSSSAMKLAGGSRYVTYTPYIYVCAHINITITPEKLSDLRLSRCLHASPHNKYTHTHIIIDMRGCMCQYLCGVQVGGGIAIRGTAASSGCDHGGAASSWQRVPITGSFLIVVARQFHQVPCPKCSGNASVCELNKANSRFCVETKSYF